MINSKEVLWLKSVYKKESIKDDEKFKTKQSKEGLRGGGPSLSVFL
ncbi:MAG: hypothetical protein WCY75_04835 [Sulfurimonadaceae bacterium]